MRNLVSFAYTYDNADQRTRVTREDGRVINYGYDAIGQLTNAFGGVYQYGYQYDETGNPIRQDKGGFIASNAFNHLNQNVESGFSGSLSVWGSKQGPLPATVTVNNVTAQPWGLAGWNVSGLPFVQGTNLLTTIIADIAGRITTNASQTVVQDKTYEYDLNGNMTRNGDFEYIWDDENRLIAVKKAGLLIQQNRYDGLSRRVEKREYSGGYILTNRYVYDGWTVVVVLNGENEVLEYYGHGLDVSGFMDNETGGVGNILAVQVMHGIQALHYDGNGNVMLVTDADAMPIARMEYSPFGEMLILHGTPLRYQFSTKEYDYNAGLMYYGYRYYVPDFGRWLSRDPVGYNGGMNHCAFVLNSPLNYIDLLGLKTCTSTILAGHTYEVVDKARRRNKPLGCGNTVGGVACNPGLVNGNIEDMYPGQGIPGMPSHSDVVYCDNVAPPGGRKVTDEINSAVNAAQADADSKCHKKPDCCDRVCVQFLCSPDMEKCLRSLGKGHLCGKVECHNCG